ncbi:astacin-like [Anopheles cruzii]|uniref:astacin-like n=1 Tax=Anopheles cruzii TaxID=68878 RepID=UPI0022EC34FA|nr:astacin-like [Anopheles cruzii]
MKLFGTAVVGLAMVTSCVVGGPIASISPVGTNVASELEESGGNYEGDIILSPEQEDAVKHGYTAIIAESYKWPNNLVPYAIDTTAFTAAQRNSIVSALEQIELVSCVRFKARTTEKDYVMVTGAYTGCSAQLGHQGGGMQTVNLQPNGCMSRGTIIHEFLHALGFVHMQSATDREFFITVNWSNISAGKSSNFNYLSSDKIEDFGIPYDYDSVMHYSRTAFSANGLDTITPKQPGVTIGQRVGLSYKDIKRLNFRYPICYKTTGKGSREQSGSGSLLILITYPAHNTNQTQSESGPLVPLINAIQGRCSLQIPER